MPDASSAEPLAQSHTTDPNLPALERSGSRSTMTFATKNGDQLEVNYKQILSILTVVITAAGGAGIGGNLLIGNGGVDQEEWKKAQKEEIRAEFKRDKTIADALSKVNASLITLSAKVEANTLADAKRDTAIDRLNEEARAAKARLDKLPKSKRRGR